MTTLRARRVARVRSVVALVTALLASLVGVMLGTSPAGAVPNLTEGPPFSIVQPAGSVADLGVGVSDSADPVTLGESYFYSMVVFNNGPAVATDVVASLEAPGAVILSAFPTSGSCTVTPQMVECDLGTVAGFPQGVDIGVMPFEPGTVTATATVASAETDPNPANNTAVEDTTIVAPPSPEADLAVGVSDSADPVTLGDTYFYDMVVLNNGPDVATDVVLSLDLSGAAVSIDDASSPDGSCTVTAPTVECDLGTVDTSGVLASITVTPNEPGTVTATGTVASAETDPNPANNTAVEDTTIVVPPEADLAVGLDASSPSPLSSTINYELEVTNDGPDPLEQATVETTFSGAVSNVTSPDGCSFAAGVVSCPIGAVAASASTTVEFSAQIGLLTIGPFTATSTRASSTPEDPNPANDTATATCTAVTSLVVIC